MKIYFAGSIRGGREKRKDFEIIIKELSNYGEVLTEHIGYENLEEEHEKNMTDKEIFIQDINWLTEADVIVAECSVVSLGVGYEIGVAEKLGKRIICLYDKNSEKNLSAMITGNEKIEIIYYNDIDELKGEISDIFEGE